MLSDNNKYLTVQNGVKLTESLDKVIFTLDDYFKDKEYQVSSGLRSKNSQLHIICKIAKEKKIPIFFNENDYDMKVDGIYIWQVTWSKLLDLGFVINPPNTAEYIGDNPSYKGRVLQVSTHIIPGNAFDISKYYQDICTFQTKDLDTVSDIITYAIADWKNKGMQQLIKSVKPEPKNRCFHINTKETI